MDGVGAIGCLGSSGGTVSGPVIPEAVHKLCEGCGRSVLLAVLVLQPRRRLLCARCYLVAEYEHERHKPTSRGIPGRRSRPSSYS